VSAERSASHVFEVCLDMYVDRHNDIPLIGLRSPVKLRCVGGRTTAIRILSSRWELDMREN
jgi:hypothetical protein